MKGTLAVMEDSFFSVLEHAGNFRLLCKDGIVFMAAAGA